ncbi:putative sulfite oxidase [Colletotrichum orbiculare MAFF 240422]|uniref:Nitrate reductase [NADPH] n=1 Tax=Colletotrichum orbiculare (strain 104-T / ATCC 96160 / CBS 514.97 / LARS 414 / MAFF 240422) TaxID=1213857 RepID=A0A484G7M1_COLOR|nr:putative sulfite oxidase [Colletotrichum orbiculare MAFF 240422]
MIAHQPSFFAFRCTTTTSQIPLANISPGPDTPRSRRRSHRNSHPLQPLPAKATPRKNPPPTPSPPTRWPRYRLSENKLHDAASDTPWITYGNSVYDITEWIAAHPGGDVILRAAGGAVEPLLTLTARPRNAETPPEALRHFITPGDMFYVRNHMWVPVVENADAHTVTVEALDGEERVYTLKELQTRFRVHKVTATLQCAGNRRKDMTDHAGKTNGLQWSAGAVSTADWEGVRLRDVLADATGTSTRSTAALLPEDVKHVHYAGLEACAVSIPASKAADPHGDVLLAFRMNDHPLARDHGFPIRTIVPGNVAARSVKWLRRITLSDEESPSQWQRRDCKAFCPGAGAHPDWNSAPAIKEMPVTSAITAARSKNKPDGKHVVSAEGYAYSGGGREIVRVDVSTDRGRTWRPAELFDDSAVGQKAWCWKRWRYEGDLSRGSIRGQRGVEFVVKATDEAYNTQPESYESIYNVRGNLATAWHRVNIDGPATA